VPDIEGFAQSDRSVSGQDIPSLTTLPNPRLCIRSNELNTEQKRVASTPTRHTLLTPSIAGTD